MDRPLVGVAIAVRKPQEQKLLIHKRKGNHAPNTWAFPGGHLEMFESFEECVLRELREEAGSEIFVSKPKYFLTLNTIFPDESKHYVLIMMVADWVSGDAYITEPDKNHGWRWSEWRDIPSPRMNGLQIMIENNWNPLEYKF